PFRNFKLYRLRFTVFSLFVLALPVAAFDKSDLAMVSKRTIFYERLPYAVGVSGKIEDTKIKPGTTELTIYYVSGNCYDPIFSIQIGFPADIEKTQEAVTFRHDTASLRLGADGIRYTVNRAFTSDASSSGPLMRVIPDSIRFDDATAFTRREGKVTSQRVQPYALTPLSDSPLLPQAERFFSDTKQFEPDTVIRTREGLWTCWRFDLKSEGVSSFLDPKGARFMIGSGKTLMFYNAANKVNAGGKINLTMSFRIQPEEAFPVPEQPAAGLSMVDTHVHITTDTDMRDSILMARRHGFQYWMVSILYDEHPPYGRLFTGNAHMFEMMRRAPDVFLGFGLLQLEDNGYPGFPRPGPDKPEQIQRLWEQGCVGLKTLVKFSKNEVQVDNPKFDPLWAKAAELHMPIVFHTEAEDTGSSHTRVAAVARRFPGSPFVLAHLWDGQIDITVKELKATPNLFIQHMHLARKAADGKTALERLIAEGLAAQILFGSDVTNDHSPLIADQFQFIARLRELKVPEATIERIMFASANEMSKRVAPRVSDQVTGVGNESVNRRAGESEYQIKNADD
ncbi:MAG: amidohydrolase family protein, partial [Lentisphaerota bacterium]